MYVPSLWIQKEKDFSSSLYMDYIILLKIHPSYFDENGIDVSLQNEHILENNYLTKLTVTSASESSSSDSDSDQ